MKRYLAFLLVVACCAPAMLRAQQKTTVADTLLAPDGSAVSGKLSVTAPTTFVSADGYTVFAQTKTTATLSAGGAFSLALIPNAGATPSGTSYVVQYTISGHVTSEYWTVPSSATAVNLAAVRTATPPSPTLMFAFAQLNPPANCAAGQVPIWSGLQWNCGAAPAGNWSNEEGPAGQINGLNVTFTLAHPPSPAGSLRLALNGLALHSGLGNDFTLSGSTITFAVAPPAGSNLICWYQY